MDLEMEMGQWVMGQMGRHFWISHMGQWVTASEPKQI